MIRHTQEEIAERAQKIRSNDFFGVETSALVSAMTLTHAQPFLKEEAWSTWQPTPEHEIRIEALNYLSFAVDKATNHRGLSASRSVDHYRGWVWLLAPELFAGFDAAPYSMYGVPQLKAAALALGFDDAWAEQVAKHPELERMAEGLPCVDGCEEGCR